MSVSSLEIPYADLPFGKALFNHQGRTSAKGFLTDATGSTSYDKLAEPDNIWDEPAI
jgi:hypothetical protein